MANKYYRIGLLTEFIKQGNLIRCKREKFKIYLIFVSDCRGRSILQTVAFRAKRHGRYSGIRIKQASVQCNISSYFNIVGYLSDVTWNS